jgi:hypothetical protein
MDSPDTLSAAYLTPPALQGRCLRAPTSVPRDDCCLTCAGSDRSLRASRERDSLSPLDAIPQIIRIAVWICSRARRGAVRATHAAASTTPPAGAQLRSPRMRVAPSWWSVPAAHCAQGPTLGVRPQVANPSPDAEPDLSIAIVVLRWDAPVGTGYLWRLICRCPKLGAGPPEPHGCPLTEAPLRNIMIL